MGELTLHILHSQAKQLPLKVIAAKRSPAIVLIQRGRQFRPRQYLLDLELPY